jgi:O-antigen/teichoic acid export membrane protein
MIWQNRILRAYGTSLLGVFSGLVTNLWLLREITRHVSVTDFGLYAFVLQISAYLSILQLGLDFAASRQIAESLGKNDPDSANRAFWELKRVNRISVWVVALGVLCIAIAFWSGIGISKGGPRNLAATIALLAGAAQTIGFLSRPFSAALIGSQYLSAVNLLTAGRTIVTSVLAYVILVRGLGILSVPIAEVAMQVLAWMVLKHLYRSCCSWRTTHAPSRDRHLLRSIFKFGSVATIGGFAWTIEATSDVIILGWFAGPALVAIYVLWWRFPQMLFDLCTRLAFSAFPGFAQRHGESAAASRILFGKVSALSIGLATVALLGVSLWLPTFIHVWIGDKYIVQNPKLLALGMGLLICLRTCGNLLAMFWMATGRANLPTVSNWAQAAIKVGVALLVVKQYGIVGLVGASCLAATLQIVFVGAFLLKEQFVDARQILRNVALVSIAFIAALVAWRLPTGMGIAYLAVGAFITIIAWAPIWLIFAWKTELRPSLVSVVGGISHRLGMPWLAAGR